MTKNIRPLTLDIDEKLWEDYKDVVPRKITLNDSVVNLIKREVERKSHSKK